MKKTYYIFASLTLFTFLLVSCKSNNDGKKNPPVIEKLFTITWKNYDGTILETDKDVKKGVIPTYDGATPTKPSDAQFTYTFKGWDPEITEVTKDQVYTAIYSSEKIKEETYTITWKNFDGTVLEIDNEVVKDTIPTYDGATPTKPSDTHFTYTFKGWDPEVAPATKNQIYTATYTSTKIINEDEKYAKKPILSEDGKTIKYGLYPQTNVNDESLIASLNSLTAAKSNGWYLYNGEYYAKLNATPRTKNYKFDNGTVILSGTTYWFKCEPLVWNVLSNNNGDYYLLSSVLLDVGQYYHSTSHRTIDDKKIKPNNYKYSDVHNWLNNDFYNTAFALNNSYILTTAVDNSASTTNGETNPNTCENTYDKVFLPSYKDYKNKAYGFYFKDGFHKSRCCKATDWTRARGLSLATQTGEYAYNGYYWTRSPDTNRTDFVCYISYDGTVKHDYIHADWETYRPAITIKIL